MGYSCNFSVCRCWSNREHIRWINGVWWRGNFTACISRELWSIWWRINLHIPSSQRCYMGWFPGQKSCWCDSRWLCCRNAAYDGCPGWSWVPDRRYHHKCIPVHLRWSNRLLTGRCKSGWWLHIRVWSGSSLHILHNNARLQRICSNEQILLWIHGW